MMPEKLDINRIQSALVSECSVHLFENIGSTNEWALQKIREGEPMPFACFAEQQTRGRGRRGRSWVSPGSNITMSLAWLFELPADQLNVLSLAMGISVVNVLRKLGLQHVMLKWPNDVLVEDKKIAGILIETTKLSDRTSSVVIGIGLNYQFPESLPDEIDQPWTDVVTSLKSEPNGGRNNLAGLLLQECMTMCEQLPQQAEKIINEFNDHYDACAQKQVSVLLENDHPLTGIACGITSKAEIRVLIDGKEQVFNSADISLNKMTSDRSVETKKNKRTHSC